MQNAIERTSLVVQWISLSAKAGDTGFDPWSEKIPRAMEELSPYTTATEPEL